MMKEAPFRESKKTLFIALTLFIFLLVLNYLSRDTRYETDPDAFSLAQAIEGSRSGEISFFHPIWLPFGKALWSLWKMFGYGGASFVPLQSTNIIIGALTVVFFFLFLLKLTESQSLSLVLALCLNGSWYWWAAWSGIFPMSFGFLLMMACLWLLLYPGKRRLLAFSGSLLCFIAGMFFHISNLLFLPGALALVLLKKESAARKAAGTSLYLLAVVAVFLANFTIAFKSLPVFRSCFDNVFTGGFKQLLQYRELLFTVYAAARGHWGRIFAGYFWNFDLPLGRKSPDAAFLETASVMLLLAVLTALFIINRRQWLKHRNAVTASALSMLVYFLGFIFIDPLDRNAVIILLHFYLLLGLFSAPLMKTSWRYPLLGAYAVFALFLMNSNLFQTVFVNLGH